VNDLAHLRIVGNSTTPTIAIVGEIDISNIAEIGNAIDRTVTDAVVLTIDLSATTFLDSAAIALLFELADRLHTTRREMYIVIPDDAPIRRLAKLSGLDAQVPVLPHRDDINRDGQAE
jgi:anti-anti-sigma factor